MEDREEYRHKYKEAIPINEPLVHIDCPECHTPTKAENINLDQLLAKCHHCAAVFDFERKLPPFRNKKEVYLPKGMEVLHLRNELEIQYKWRKNNSSFGVFFTVLWNAMLIPFVMGIVMSGNWMMLLFLSAHLAVGMGMIYNTLTHLLNTTYVTVDASKIAIEHRPLRLPFKGDTDIRVEDIHQIYVEQYSNGSTNGVPNIVYQVKAVLQNKNQIVLINGFRHAEPAQYVEQEIEVFLRIDDKTVRNEY